MTKRFPGCRDWDVGGRDWHGGRAGDVLHAASSGEGDVGGGLP